MIALAQGVELACFEVFRFTSGSLTDRENFLVEDIGPLPTARRSSSAGIIPCGSGSPPGDGGRGAGGRPAAGTWWLTEKAGRRVHIVQPQKGEQAQLVEMCRSNAAERIAHREGSGFSGRDAAALD